MRINGIVTIEAIGKRDFVGVHLGVPLEFRIPPGLIKEFQKYRRGQEIKVLAIARKGINREELAWNVLESWPAKTRSERTVQKAPEKIERNHHSGPSSIPCYCEKDGERTEYGSFREAAEAWDVTITTIGNRVRRDKRGRDGWMWGKV